MPSTPWSRIRNSSPTSRRLNVELDPLPGERVQELITRTLAVPASVRERAKVAFGR